MRDLETTLASYGKTLVAINTWRNDNRTAFAQIIVEDYTGRRFVAEAKSQGPGSGGFCKPTQALQRLASALKLPSPREWQARDVQALANQVAQIDHSARETGCTPTWKA